MALGLLMGTGACLAAAATPASAATQVGSGTVTASASCIGTGPTYTVNVSVSDVISAIPANNDPTTGKARVGLVVADPSNINVAGPVGTDVNGNATFPAFTYNPHGVTSVQFEVGGNRVDSGVDLFKTVDFPNCAPPAGHGTGHRNSNGTVTFSVSATGLEPTNGTTSIGDYLLIYNGTVLAEKDTDASGNVSFSNVTVSGVSAGARSFTVSIEHRRRGGIELPSITVTITNSGGGSTGTPSGTATHTGTPSGTASSTDGGSTSGSRSTASNSNAVSGTLANAISSGNPSGSLAATGTDTTRFGAIGTGLLTVGLVVALIGRRRYLARHR